MHLELSTMIVPRWHQNTRNQPHCTRGAYPAAAAEPCNSKPDIHNIAIFAWCCSLCFGFAMEVPHTKMDQNPRIFECLPLRFFWRLVQGVP